MRDYGNEETEKLLKELETKINREYRIAVDETQKKLDDYLRRFETKDRIWQKMVADGEKSKAEYDAWRTGQIMVGKRWEEMRDTLAEDYHNANLIARSTALGYMPEVYAINHNYATFEIEMQGMVDTSYTLYNREAVERIMRDDPDLLQPPGAKMKNTFAIFDAYKNGEEVDVDPKTKKAFDKILAQNKDIRWQEGQIQSVTMQSILQGESIPHMSRRIARTMGEINHASSIRYARTAVTGAQNAGRQDAYHRAQALGVDMQREWLATLDMRTRHEHRMLDGQKRGVDEPFEVDGEEIMYPGDPSAPGHLVWNCRCRTVAAVNGWEDKVGQLRSNSAIEGMTYEEWKNGKELEPDGEFDY